MWETSTISHALVEVGDHWLDPFEISAVTEAAGDNRVWVMLACGQAVVVKMPHSGDPVGAFMAVIRDALKPK